MQISDGGRERIVLLGAGGHSDVVRYTIARAGRYEVVGLVADPPHAAAPDVPILGDDSVLPRLLAQGIAHAFVAVGACGARLRLAAEVDRLGFNQPSVVSTSAELAPSVSVGAGSIVMAAAVIHPNASIGRYAIINTGAIVEHGCRIADGVHIAPGSVLCADVSVGQGTFIGAGVTVIPGVRIGANAVVGAGATVIRDIPDGETHVGTPAVRSGRSA